MRSTLNLSQKTNHSPQFENRCLMLFPFPSFSPNAALRPITGGVGVVWVNAKCLLCGVF